MSDLLLPLYVSVFLVAFALTVFIEKMLIPYLKSQAKQPIYELGPVWHKSKSGTPTMGGIAFLIAIGVALLLCCAFLVSNTYKNEAWLLILPLMYAVLNATVGIIDDRQKIKQRKNDKGLLPWQKLVMQFIASISYVTAVSMICGINTVLAFGGFELNLGVLYYPFAVIVLVGITNCANLTDGIDGLASSVAFAIGVALFYISYSQYESGALISCALMGGSCGFLVFNLHPAKIFMGDTGSLFLGSLIASLSLIIGNPIVVIIICSVYVIEGLSVILQVIYYKATRKRLFRMAPLHHHLEKCGWSENKICIVAIIITLVASIPVSIAFIK